MEYEQHIYVGIDFSKDAAHFAIQRWDGRALERHRRFDNSQQGYEAAKAWLLQHLRQQPGPVCVAIGGEATSYYWLPLYLALEQDAELAHYQPRLYLLNARWVKWFKKSKSPNHKDDRIDPSDIADYIRFQQPKTTWHSDLRWLPLRSYTRLRAHLAKSLVREKNLLNLYVFLLYSTYIERHPFSDPLSQTSRRLLRNPNLLEELRQMDLEELTEQLHELSQHRLHDPQANAQRLQQVLAERYRIDPVLTSAFQFNLDLLLDTLDHLEQQIQRVEARIQAVIQDDFPEVAWLDSIPGIGLVLASGIAAEIADLTRFSGVPVWDERRKTFRPRTSSEVADAVAKYAGLWWPKNASGKFDAEERHLSREGNAYLRYYTLEAVESMRRSLPAFATYFQTKSDAANKHKHKRALVLTGCKALDLFVTLLRRKEPYRAREVLS